jgi:hypothetical protein
VEVYTGHPRSEAAIDAGVWMESWVNLGIPFSFSDRELETLKLAEMLVGRLSRGGSEEDVLINI